jgi:hypothetical protein
MTNPEVTLTLDDAVAEVLGLLTGLDLEYDPEQDRYRAITRQLNRALRAIALENEWSYYASTQQIGTAAEGGQSLRLTSSQRPRIVNDDAVRLIDEDGITKVWAYFLPRDAIHKYANKKGLWVAITQLDLLFSRPFYDYEDGWTVEVPIMREPIMFRLPETGEVVEDHIRNQEVDFSYPDLVTARAAYFYAQTDPVMQPRVQTLEADYKSLMYQLIERDIRHTDTPFYNEYLLPLENGLIHQTVPEPWPHSNYS